MKKSKFFGLALVATMASFTACTNDVGEVLAQEGEIRLTSEITPSRVTNPELQSTQIVPGRLVGVTITGAKTEHNNVAWTVGETGGLNNTGDAIYYGDGTATVTAYHPYNSTWTSTSHTFSVNTNQSENANYLNSDLLWATASSAKKESAIPLVFTHKLAKINVTIIPEKDEADFSGATISICNTKITTTFNPKTGEISEATGDVHEIVAGITTADAYTASSIVIPQEVSGKFIKITHEGKTYYYTLVSGKTLESGYSYSYTLTVKGKQLISTGSSIDKWEGEEDINEGVAEEESIEAVDLGLSVKWASCNLGAIASKAAGSLYAWGETSPKYNFTQTNYTYYDTENEEYIEIGNDIGGTQYDAAYLTLGKGWRIPTHEEWEELKTNCRITAYTGENSFYLEFRSTINNNVIYLPANNSRPEYWASTTNVNEQGEINGIYYFNLNPNDSELKFDNNRYLGYQVRPVYDEKTQEDKDEVDLSWFNPNQYISYVSNYEMIQTNDDASKPDLEIYRSYIKCPSYSSISKVEIKFQMIDNDYFGTESTPFRVWYGGGISLYDNQISVSGNTYLWDDLAVEISDLIVLNISYKDKYIKLNGVDLEHNIASDENTISTSGYFFSGGYSSDYDDGWLREWKAGVSEGSKLYYVKFWDENDELVYLGAASTALNPTTNVVENCWRSYYNGITDYQFAHNSETLSNYEPYGGGTDE